MPFNTETIEKICTAIAAHEATEASLIARREMPFEPIAPTARRYIDAEAVQLFLRDGFIDRYSGDRLVFPGVLRLLSLELPAEIPYHTNWKMTDCHPVYSHLWPTIDHIIPMAQGCDPGPDNWVTTSMLRNAAKAHWCLDQLGWTLHEAGDPRHWDGMIGWFMKQVEARPVLLGHAGLRRWHRAAKRALSADGNA